LERRGPPGRRRYPGPQPAQFIHSSLSV